MNVIIFGATGMIGQRIVEEALTRGHSVTAVVRDASKVKTQHKDLEVVVGDILNVDSSAKLAIGKDAVISSFGPSHDRPESLVEATNALIAIVKLANTKRLIAVGGAGSLEVAPGLQVVDTPNFPDAYKPIALAHRDALEVYKQSDINWTNLSPAAVIEPGKRTGNYQVGTNQLLVNAEGNSYISAEDYAVALIDELENAKFVGKRFTAAN